MNKYLSEIAKRQLSTAKLSQLLYNQILILLQDKISTTCDNQQQVQDLCKLHVYLSLYCGKKLEDAQLDSTCDKILNDLISPETVDTNSSEISLEKFADGELYIHCNSDKIMYNILSRLFETHGELMWGSETQQQIYDQYHRICIYDENSYFYCKHCNSNLEFCICKKSEVPDNQIILDIS